MAETKETGVPAYSMPSDRELLITVNLDAPRERVFSAWTDPEQLPHWLKGAEDLVLTVRELDLRPGGAWRFAWRDSKGKETESHGKYKEVVFPKRTVYTDKWPDDLPETLNTMTFDEDNGRTTLSLHILYTSKETRDTALATGMKDGMAFSFRNLQEYLHKGQ